MSKIYSKYLQIKSSNLYSNNTLFLFKSGIFFMFVAEDAVKASSLLGLKLSHLNESVLKCSFPISSFEKYEQLLKDLNYSLQIVDMTQSSSLSSLEYINNQKIYTVIKQIVSTNIDYLSISEAYDLLHYVKAEFSNIIEGSDKNG